MVDGGFLKPNAHLRTSRQTEDCPCSVRVLTPCLSSSVLIPTSCGAILYGDSCQEWGLVIAVDGLPVERAVLERFRHELDHIIRS